MREIALSEALETLENAFGPTLETDRDRGLELMREALEADHDVTAATASDILESLQEGGQLAWTTQDAAATGAFGTTTLPERPLTPTVQTAPGVVPVERGYWRIGAARPGRN